MNMGNNPKLIAACLTAAAVVAIIVVEGGADRILPTPEWQPLVWAKEPSGILVHPGTGDVWVADDRGVVLRIPSDGSEVRTIPVAGDLEDLCLHGPTGLICLVAESEGVLILFAPTSCTERGRIPIDAADLMPDVGTRANDGFEGIAFRPAPGRPGGGVFVLTHQYHPSAVIELAFDPADPPRVINRSHLVGRWSCGYSDLAAVRYHGPTGRLLILSDASDCLLVCSVEGRVLGRVHLAGEQQEGFDFDRSGNLLVVQDVGGLLRFSGAEVLLARYH
jgi:uncharacterized protein YjiK